jgi:glutathione synthase/RimK-type ligase-like ATP-grasp enzyme
MIVIISNSLDVTADYVCSRLEQGQFDYVRLDTDYLTGKTELLYKFDNLSLVVDQRTLVPENINSIWYRRPQPLKPPAEKTFEKGEQAHALSEWSAAIEGFLAHIPTKLWINHPRNNASAASKLEQLSRARRLGLTIPKTLVTQSFEETIEFWKECKESLVVKPISHGYIERENSQEDTLIFTNEVTLDQLNKNRELLSLCPTLFQEKVEKIYDIRINVIDDEVIAVAIYASKEYKLQTIDIRKNNMQNVRDELVTLPSILINKILELCRSYELRFAAIDMAFTKDYNWVFFEINPNGQWAWLDLEGVTDIASLLLKSMQLNFS